MPGSGAVRVGTNIERHRAGQRVRSTIPSPFETVKLLGKGIGHVAHGIGVGASWAGAVGLPATLHGAKQWWGMGKGLQQLAAGGYDSVGQGRWVNPATGWSAESGQLAGMRDLRITEQQRLARRMPYNYEAPHEVYNRWGMGTNPESFWGRGAMGHMSRIGHNVGFTMTGLTANIPHALRDMGRGAAGMAPASTVAESMGRLSVGAFLYGGALLQSDDNLLSATDGYPRYFARGLGEFIGGDIGVGVGSAVGTVIAPALGIGSVAASAVGFLGGGILGAVGFGMLADIPWQIAEIGAQERPFKSHFMDSERASTMRQRAVQMINRSHMNARSALSMEAAAYHL